VVDAALEVPEWNRPYSDRWFPSASLMYDQPVYQAVAVASLSGDERSGICPGPPSWEVTVVPDRSASMYQQLLQEAREIGRADGRFAAAFEGPDGPAGHGDRCLGRTPSAFAELLWEGRPGTPPSGLVVNAPLWYATGFAEGLRERAARPRRTATTLSFRRVFS
jgi:hypothetical protein